MSDSNRGQLSYIKESTWGTIPASALTDLRFTSEDFGHGVATRESNEVRSDRQVPDAVRVKVVDPEAIFLLGLLGESGRELVRAGVLFYFEGKLAKKLIEKGIAKEV